VGGFSALNIASLVQRMRLARRAKWHTIDVTALNWMHPEALEGIPFFFTENLLHETLAEQAQSTRARLKNWFMRLLNNTPSQDERFLYMMKYMNALYPNERASRRQLWRDATQRAIHNFVAQHRSVPGYDESYRVRLQRVESTVQTKIQKVFEQI